MANFKRRRARISARNNRVSYEFMTRRLGKSPDNFYANSPSWWNILFHSRPHRRYTKLLEHKIMRGEKNLIFPLARKPHKYYW